MEIQYHRKSMLCYAAERIQMADKIPAKTLEFQRLNDKGELDCIINHGRRGRREVPVNLLPLRGICCNNLRT